AAGLHVQIGDVEAHHPRAARLALVEVSRFPAHALVAAGAEGLGALAGEHDDADVRVLAGVLERPRDLDHGARAKGVANLRPVDRDLGDALRIVRLLIADVGELVLARGHSGLPLGAHGAKATFRDRSPSGTERAGAATR